MPVCTERNGQWSKDFDCWCMHGQSEGVSPSCDPATHEAMLTGSHTSVLMLDTVSAFQVRISHTQL